MSLPRVGFGFFRQFQELKLFANAADNVADSLPAHRLSVIPCGSWADADGDGVGETDALGVGVVPALTDGVGVGFAFNSAELRTSPCDDPFFLPALVPLWPALPDFAVGLVVGLVVG